jgi:hypothetical protein
MDHSYDYPPDVLLAHSKDHEHPGLPEDWWLTDGDEEDE